MIVGSISFGLSGLDARLWFVNIPPFPLSFRNAAGLTWRGLISSTGVLFRYGFVITKHGGYLRMVL